MRAPSPQKLILDAIGDRLAQLTLANGYSFEAGKIERSRLEPFTPIDFPAINYWLGTDNAAGNSAYRTQERQMTVVIEFYGISRDENFTDVGLEMAADLCVAIRRGPNAPKVGDQEELTFGGVIRKVELSSLAVMGGKGQAPWCGCAAEFIISYVVSASDFLTLVS